MSYSLLQNTLPIQSATTVDANRCFHALTQAFENDPVCRWVWPDDRQYWAAFPRFAEAFGGKALRLATAFHIEDFSGVSLWLPPGEEPNAHSVIQVLHNTVANDVQEAVFSMFEQMDSYHPTEPYWYLPLIGVVPRCQRQ